MKRTRLSAFALVYLLLTTHSLNATERLINGQAVSLSEWPEVIRLNSGCTATVVGPKAIATASHCVQYDGQYVSFIAQGRSYSARVVRHPNYISQGAQYDLAIGITSERIFDVNPASIGGSASAGQQITLFGYGCTTPTGNGQAIGGNDGILRMGNSTIQYFSGTDMVSQGGAALCYGDSGGPAFVFSGGTRFLLGINSKGNIYDTSYNMRTDLSSSRSFLQNVASQNGIDICGINIDC